MRRREVMTLIGGLAASAVWPRAGRAQQPRIPLVGLLGSSGPGRFRAFEMGLREAGYIGGRNVAIEAQPDGAQLAAFAADLVRRQASVIFATPTAAALAAKRTTSTIPIVFLIGGDPVRFGLVDSFNRPGANVTGVSLLVNSLVTKRLGFLSTLIPGKDALGMLVDPTNPNVDADIKEARAAAAALGRDLYVVNASAQRELEPAFESLAQQRVAALLVGPNARFAEWIDQLAALAGRHALPASFSGREFVAAGGLMSYATDIADAFRQSGFYVGKILKGAKPAELPVVQSTGFELVLNLKTAKTLGLTIGPELLSVADEVIE
jgi:putative ABC transport system substrate-binding protein